MEPTRKDIATSYTRKLVFDELPDLAISHAYRDFDEVVFSVRCLHLLYPYRPDLSCACEQYWWMESSVKKWTELIISPTSPIGPLHVHLCVEPYRYIHENVITLFHLFDSYFHCTYELSLHWIDDHKTMYIAYEMQCVVNFKETQWHSTNARYIAHLINECFEEEGTAAPAGQLFLCDFPRLILTPEEFAPAADNREETAIIKIHDLITVWPDLSNSVYNTKLDFLKSRVKLVKSDFKPSLTDLYPRPQSKSVFSFPSWQDRAN